MSAADLRILLHRALESRVEHLAGLLAVPGWQEDPERLHQVRVASRRARSALGLVRPGDYPRHRRQSRDLKRLTRALGAARELDVHARDLAALAARNPGPASQAALEHALEALEDRRARARKKMARGLAGRPCRRLAELLALPGPGADLPPGTLAAAAWARLAPGCEAALSPLAELLEREDPEALHRARIRIKRLRYDLEVLADAFPEPPAALLQRLRDLQTALGDHHDLTGLEAFLRELHEGLARRGRGTLAGGLLELLSGAGEARRAALARFRLAVEAAPLEAFRSGLEPEASPAVQASEERP